MRKLSYCIFLFGILIIGGTLPSLAQNAHPVPGPAAPKEPAPKEPVVSAPVLVAPYDEKLMRLAEVLGSIHYLRELCKANEGQLWRTKMSALINAEQPKPVRKTRMIARFNRGYGVFNRTYQACTPSALLAIDRYMKEGVLLTSQINTRYGR